MLYRVEVDNTQAQSLALPLDTYESGYIVKNIDGLEPVKATLVGSTIAQMDGEIYHLGRREPRTIRITLGLRPNYSEPTADTVGKLRAGLYSFFSPKNEVLLRFFREDEDTVEIIGIVESFENPLFTKEPSVDISIRCFNPDFVALESTTLNLSTVSNINGSFSDFVYEGTVPAGINLTITLTRNLTGGLTLYHNDGSHLDLNASLLNGDVVHLFTGPGVKSVLLIRGAVSSSLLYAVSSDSNWINLKPGLNSLMLVAADTPVIPYVVNYTARYGGL